MTSVWSNLLTKRKDHTSVTKWVFTEMLSQLSYLCYQFTTFEPEKVKTIFFPSPAWWAVIQLFLYQKWYDDLHFKRFSGQQKNFNTRESKKRGFVSHSLIFFMNIRYLLYGYVVFFFAVAIFDLIPAYSVEITEVSFLIS